MLCHLIPNSLSFRILFNYPLPAHAPSNFQKKIYCHQDKSGIHNTLTLLWMVLEDEVGESTKHCTWCEEGPQ